MWKPEHRAAADRRGVRYESDLTDAEWALVGSLIPPAKRGGRPRTVNVREVLNRSPVLMTIVPGLKPPPNGTVVPAFAAGAA